MKKILFILIATTALTATAQEQSVYSHRTAEAEVILLSEGQNPGRLNTLVGATPQMIAQAAPDGSYPTATNAFLIRTRSGRNILIDTGLGRELFNNLQRAGVSAESIDAVLMTHLHGDHTGGLVREGKAAFPRAKLYMSTLEAGSADENTRRMMALYELVTFEPAAGTPVAVFDEVKALPCYGHTAGHTAYLIGNVAIWGDLAHAMAFQMPFPQVAVTYDRAPETAVASRRTLLEYFTANGYTVGGMHVPYPAIGTLASDGAEGYVFTPLK